MHRILIAGAAVGAFTLLCWDASRRLADAYPTLPQCLRNPEKNDGKPIWFNPVPVVATDAGSFEVFHWGGRVRVHSSIQPPVGALVMVYGTFRRDGSVSAIAWEVEDDYVLKRRGVLLVSLVVVIVGIFVFHRSFAWRNGAFHPR